MKRETYFGLFGGAALLLTLVGACADSGGTAKVASEPRAAGAPATARLISDEQYANAISAIFGEDLAPNIPASNFRRVGGLSALGSKDAGVSASSIATFEAVSRQVSTKIVDGRHRPYLIQCTPAAADKPDDACASAVLSEYGRLLFRRSLSKQELNSYVAVAHTGAEALGDFYRGLSSGLARMLVSPSFLFFIETTEPDPSRRGHLRLTSEAKASRLALFLWNGPPDGALLDAAARGDLHDRKLLEHQVDRMLASPRVKDAMGAFFKDMLGFESFNTLTKDQMIYPAFSQDAAPAALEQSLRMIVDHLVVKGGDYRELFTTRNTFLHGNLSQLYKVAIPRPSEWTPYELPVDSGRAGLLTQAGFLAYYSKPGRSSPTQRGKALREALLCQKVPDPPANVDFSGFEDPKSLAKTTRDRLNAHATNPVCAGCHKLTDPIGLALENFDSAGQFRRTENGVAIDARGELNGVKFDDAVGLGKALANDPAVTQCVVSRLYSYGRGSALTPEDNVVVDDLHAKFAAHGYRVTDLLKLIATSTNFYAVSNITQTKTAAGAPVPAADRAVN